MLQKVLSNVGNTKKQKHTILKYVIFTFCVQFCFLMWFAYMMCATKGFNHSDNPADNPRDTVGNKLNMITKPMPPL